MTGQLSLFVANQNTIRKLRKMCNVSSSKKSGARARCWLHLSHPLGCRRKKISSERTNWGASECRCRGPDNARADELHNSNSEWDWGRDTDPWGRHCCDYCVSECPPRTGPSSSPRWRRWWCGLRLRSLVCVQVSRLCVFLWRCACWIHRQFAVHSFPPRHVSVRDIVVFILLVRILFLSLLFNAFLLRCHLSRSSWAFTSLSLSLSLSLVSLRLSHYLFTCFSRAPAPLPLSLALLVPLAVSFLPHVLLWAFLLLAPPVLSFLPHALLWASLLPAPPALSFSPHVPVDFCPQLLLLL